jgi:hypothetical protein
MTTEPHTTWPYDADPHDPLTKHRIPVVGSAWPGWAYIVAFDSGRLDDEHHRPNERETAQLRSFLEEYLAYWYNPGWIAKMAERPFDIDGGANGITFRKWGENDWGFRRRTWQYGPVYVPQSPNLRDRHEPKIGPLTLVQVMDRINSIGDDRPMQRWIDWKAQHPDAFGEPQP